MQILTTAVQNRIQLKLAMSELIVQQIDNKNIVQPHLIVECTRVLSGALCMPTGRPALYRQKMYLLLYCVFFQKNTYNKCMQIMHKSGVLEKIADFIGTQPKHDMFESFVMLGNAMFWENPMLDEQMTVEQLDYIYLHGVQVWQALHCCRARSLAARVRHSVKIKNKKCRKRSQIGQFGAILLFVLH